MTYRMKPYEIFTLDTAFCEERLVDKLPVIKIGKKMSPTPEDANDDADIDNDRNLKLESLSVRQRPIHTSKS